MTTRLPEPPFDAEDQHWADVADLSAAVRAHAKVCVRLEVEQGCARCRGLPFAARIKAGHDGCAAAEERTAGIKRLAYALDVDLDVLVSRALDDLALIHLARDLNVPVDAARAVAVALGPDVSRAARADAIREALT